MVEWDACGINMVTIEAIEDEEDSGTLCLKLSESDKDIQNFLVMLGVIIIYSSGGPGVSLGDTHIKDGQRHSKKVRIRGIHK